MGVGASAAGSPSAAGARSEAGARLAVGSCPADGAHSADSSVDVEHESPVGSPSVVGASSVVGSSSVVGPSSPVGSRPPVGSRSEDDLPRSGERCPTPGEVRAAEEDRAVEQALALVGRQSSGEPHSVSGSHAERQPHSMGRPRLADEPAAAPRSLTLDRSPDAAPGHDRHTDKHTHTDTDKHTGTDMGRHRHRHAASWREARALAVRSGRAVAVRASRLSLDQALGHVLAEPLVALTDLPSFDTSAMDGWVVSGPGPWNIREATGAGDKKRADAGSTRDPGILAGRSAPATLADGDAVRIATGARIPVDANAVIRSEHARVDEARGLLHAKHRVLPGQDIRPRGQECRAGDQLVPAGALVTPAVLGLGAAAGYDTLAVVPRPRVDVLVLGDELLTGGLPHDGLIRDALGPMIGPWLRTLGAEVSAPQRLGDDAAALRRALTTSDADLVITTGGTAAGPVDHVHPVLAEIGAELLVDGVAVRPGHPMLLARLRKADSAARSSERRGEARGEGPYLVGLPGNPLAAVSGLLTLAEPLLRGLAGREPEAPYRALVRDEVHGHPHDTRLVPVIHRAGGAAERPGGGYSGYGDGSGYSDGSGGTGSGAERVVPLHYNGPAMLRGIAAADGLAVVPPGGVRSGTEVEILDLPWASAMPWTEGCFT
ncbi:molybdopterin molybdotransferase MoeA [Streptomyces sp. NPDC059802]|uniref:molybdopterin molybdotransferase MoeA n=1 Tax=Streptomyces sp. NPDC059802 TaxID=3346952 RepID=UPI0036494309